MYTPRTFTLEQLDYVQVFWMAFWIFIYPTNVDYHEMDKIDTEGLSQESKDIFDFIGKFISSAPTTENWDAKLWMVIQQSGILSLKKFHQPGWNCCDVVVVIL